MEHAENPVLIINDSEHAGKRLNLQNEVFTVGRGKECDLVIDERQVSRQHIKIKRLDDVYYVEDLNSKNGTWVNGEQLKGERQLKDGDEIQLALVISMTFIATEEATAPMSREEYSGKSGRLRLDRDSRRVFCGGKEINPPLSLPQYRLLELLYDAHGAVCTRTGVIEAVWPEAISDGVSEQAIDALVRRLRDRIAEVDPEHQYIVTVRGHGFRLDNS